MSVAPLIQATARRCGTPGCRRKRGHGLFANFCAQHAEMYAQIKVEFEAERKAHRITGGLGNDSKPYHAPTCCTPGCPQPRQPGEMHCVECQVLEAA